MLPLVWTMVALGAEVAEGLGVRSPPGDDVQIAPIFGPESPGPYKHPASIAELANGDLYVAYYGGSGEYELDTAVYGARLPKGETQWTEPRVVADTPFHSDGNAVVWQAPDGLVWLFYVVRYGPTWSDSRILAKVSRDAAATWSDSMVLAWEKGMMVRGRPIVLPDGNLMLPIYHETGDDPEFVGPESASLFLIRNQKTGEWSETNRIRSPIGNIQPAVDVVEGNRLVAYCRRGGGYDGRSDGFIVRAESRDGGYTWSEGVDTAFPNPNAAVDFLRLDSGALLLVFNDSFEDRRPLTLALSVDGDQSYPYRRDIATGPGSFAYPYAVQGRDGVIHLVFTSNERTVVNHARFREGAIRDERWKTR